jgi:UDP-N-acetyl-D-glucosamine dehydrogenase
MLESKGLKCDADFFLAFSPERVDPGNQTYTTRNIQIVGGMEVSTEAAALLYGSSRRSSRSARRVAGW